MNCKRNKNFNRKDKRATCWEAARNLHNHNNLVGVLLKVVALTDVNIEFFRFSSHSKSELALIFFSVHNNNTLLMEFIQ